MSNILFRKGILGGVEKLKKEDFDVVIDRVYEQDGYTYVDIKFKKVIIPYMFAIWVEDEANELDYGVDFTIDTIISGGDFDLGYTNDDSESMIEGTYLSGSGDYWIYKLKTTYSADSDISIGTAVSFVSNLS